MLRVTPLLASALGVLGHLAVPAAGAESVAAPLMRPDTAVDSLAAGPHQPDRLVVTSSDGAPRVVRLPVGSDVTAEAARYRRQPGVRAAEPNWAFRVSAGPDDPEFGRQWGLHNAGRSSRDGGTARVADADVDAPEGWSAAYGAGRFPSSGGTVVGVIDTGIDEWHPDLQGKVIACASATTGSGQVVEGTCRDDHGHGTHVAGIIGAVAGNGVGVAGVAPDARLAVFKALDRTGVGYDADIVAAIRWLHRRAGARVINMSFGDVNRTTALDEALAEAAAAGVLLVAAAGNEGDATANYPAFHPDVMSVGAVDARGYRAPFSNCNTDVEIGGPGSGVHSTTAGGDYGARTGTSMAAAHVSGVAAVLMSQRGLDADGARTVLRSATERSSGCNGTGVVNLQRAVAAPGPQPRPRPSASRTPSPSPSASASASSWLPLPPLLGSPSSRPSPSPSTTRRTR